MIVGGRDADIAHYRGRAERLGIDGSVIFAGPRPIGMLPELLRQADVLVSPRLKGLNTPMKIYSYLDSGSAVLATRLRTHTQVLHDGMAYLVDPEPGALGRGLAELMADPELRARAGQHSEGLRAARAHAPGRAPQAGGLLHHDGIASPADTGVRRLWRSATLRSVAVLGLSGVGFAVANLVLARALPTERIRPPHPGRRAGERRLSPGRRPAWTAW